MGNEESGLNQDEVYECQAQFRTRKPLTINFSDGDFVIYDSPYDIPTEIVRNEFVGPASLELAPGNFEIWTCGGQVESDELVEDGFPLRSIYIQKLEAKNSSDKGFKYFGV